LEKSYILIIEDLMGGGLLVDNDWNGLADLIANLITKYAGVLDLDNLPNPTPVNNIEDKNRFDIAKIQIDNK
jgi:hypothetical protein